MNKVNFFLVLQNKLPEESTNFKEFIGDHICLSDELFPLSSKVTFPSGFFFIVVTCT